MDERRDPPPPAASPVLPAPAAPEPAAPAAPPRRRSWRGPVGFLAALALAFAWGALTYRELGTPARFSSAPVAAAVVAGDESPPAWVGDFANAFCAADAAHIVTRIGSPLVERSAEIESALASREWTCTDARFLGGGTNSQGEFFAYVTIGADGDEQWWVFTVVDDKVVGID